MQKILLNRVRINLISSFFFIVLAYAQSIGQESKVIYQPSEIFGDYSYVGRVLFGINHNLHEEFKQIDFFYISGPYNPITKKEEDYLVHRKYLSKSGQIVSLDVFSDSIFLYKEYTRSFNQKEDSIISSGRLISSKNNYSLITDLGLDSNGNEIYIKDTIFNLVPDGFWSLNIDHRLIEVGYYVDGKKEGEWHTIIAEYNDRKIPPIIRTTVYNSDSIISIDQIDKSKDLDFVKEKLTGKWYNEGMDWNTSKKCLDENRCNDFYVKNITDKYYTGRLRGFYNHFSLLKEGIMEYIVGTACGTGLSLETSKWSFNRNGQLILDGNKWNIEYFTEDRLIISRHIGS